MEKVNLFHYSIFYCGGGEAGGTQVKHLLPVKCIMGWQGYLEGVGKEGGGGQQCYEGNLMQHDNDKFMYCYLLQFFKKFKFLIN